MRGATRSFYSGVHGDGRDACGRVRAGGVRAGGGGVRVPSRIFSSASHVASSGGRPCHSTRNSRRPSPQRRWRSRRSTKSSSPSFSSILLSPMARMRARVSAVSDVKRSSRPRSPLRSFETCVHLKLVGTRHCSLKSKGAPAFSKAPPRAPLSSRHVLHANRTHAQTGPIRQLDHRFTPNGCHHAIPRQKLPLEPSSLRTHTALSKKRAGAPARPHRKARLHPRTCALHSTSRPHPQQ